MILDKLQGFDSGENKVLDMVETIGWQLPLAQENPMDMSKRKAVLGPNLFLTADGKVDPNPSHYLHTSMSADHKAKPILNPLQIQLDNDQSLKKLIKAAIPGQIWAYLGTAAIFISHSNSQ